MGLPLEARKVTMLKCVVVRGSEAGSYLRLIDVGITQL